MEAAHCKNLLNTLGCLLLLNMQSSVVASSDLSPSEASGKIESDAGLSELSRLQSLEERFFGRKYETDSLQSRLIRIERFVYGSEMKGENMARMSKLFKVLGLPKSAPAVFHTPNDPETLEAKALKNSSAYKSRSVNNADTEPGSDTGSSATGNSATGNSATGNEAITSSTVPTSSTNSSNSTSQTTVLSARPKGLLAVINQGIDNYNRHRFRNAEDDFNTAIEMAPGLSRAYAYLGVTLLQLNERASAMDALNSAYELDPFGTFGRYAKHSLITLAGDEEIRRRGPKDDMKTVEKTLSKVNKQASLDADRHTKQSSRSISASQLSFTRYTQRLAGEMYQTPGVEHTNEDAVRSTYIRTDATVQANNARKEAALKAAYAQESANNLKSLITAKVLPGGAKLRAFGTTLNTRYYGSETQNIAPWYIPRESAPELRAQAKSLVPRRAPSKKNATVPRNSRVLRKAKTTRSTRSKKYTKKR